MAQFYSLAIHAISTAASSRDGMENRSSQNRHKQTLIRLGILLKYWLRQNLNSRNSLRAARTQGKQGYVCDSLFIHCRFVSLDTFGEDVPHVDNFTTR